jgi:hypothetical protein
MTLSQCIQQCSCKPPVTRRGSRCLSGIHLHVTHRAFHRTTNNPSRTEHPVSLMCAVYSVTRQDPIASNIASRAVHLVTPRAFCSGCIILFHPHDGMMPGTISRSFATRRGEVVNHVLASSALAKPLATAAPELALPPLGLELCRVTLSKSAM